MLKNVSGQKIHLFAFDYTTGAPKSGDAANLTAYVAKDYGAATVLADTSATELDSTNAKGWYVFDVAQSESNGDHLLFTGKSGTANIAIVGREVVPISGSPRNTGTAQGGTATTITLASGTTSNQCGAGDIIVTTGGATSAGSSGVVSAAISGSGGSTPIATVTGWSGTIPASGTTYEIIKVGGVVPANADDLATAAQVTSVQTQTDQLQFTADGYVKADLQSILEVQQEGTGGPGDNYRPEGTEPT